MYVFLSDRFVCDLASFPHFDSVELLCTCHPMQSARIAAPGDDFCDSVWQLEIEDVSESLDPNAHKSALLTATVINDGEVSAQLC